MDATSAVLVKSRQRRSKQQPIMSIETPRMRVVNCTEYTCSPKYSMVVSPDRALTHVPHMRPKKAKMLQPRVLNAMWAVETKDTPTKSHSRRAPYCGYLH